MNAARIRVDIAALLTLSALGGWFVPQGFAQSYSSAPIRIIVPFAAGGLVDALSRVLGARVSESMGHPMIVENRPGASSTIGIDAAKSLLRAKRQIRARLSNIIGRWS